MRTNWIEIFGDGFDGYKRYLQRKFATLNDFEAEDIIQQTAMKFIYKGADLSTIHHLSAYIKTSLSNSAKDYFKKSEREVLTEFGEAVNEPDQTERFLEFEVKEKLKKAILQLDEKSRYVFVQTVIKGQDFKTLSEKTGEPIGTLLSRKNRAVAKLKLLMKDYLDE